MTAFALSLAAVAALATPPATPAATTPNTVAPAHVPASRFPGFAAELAHRPIILGSNGWAAGSHDAPWQVLARATPATRQAARWDFAIGLIHRDRAPEALGVLQVMLVDDPDLAIVPSFQLARGAVMAALDRPAAALATLAVPELGRNPEACAWRLRALEQSGEPLRALGQVACALPAINGRAPNARKPFILAAVRAAITTGNIQQAQSWLRLFADGDTAANLLRGRALLAQGDAAPARLRLERAVLHGDPEQRAYGKVELVALDIAQHRIAPRDAISRLDAIRFSWRGGEVEERALRLTLAEAAAAQDNLALLRAGATLMRYFNPGADTPAIMQQLQTAMTAMLAPDSKVPLPHVAGMFWDYRELAPSGSEGDLMVVHLADRLEAAGLYERAAELLQYQLTERTDDVAQGPLSVRVATLRILSGHPDDALQTLRNTEGPTYTQSMLWDRKRLEAVALSELGKTDAAMAALDEVPDGAAIRAEILWRRRDWKGFVAETEGTLPAGSSLSDVSQAIILRHAIALATLGREDQLQALHLRYAKAFAPLRSAAAFDMLTRPIADFDPATVSAAMAAIPSASAAGGVADLLDTIPAKPRG